MNSAMPVRKDISPRQRAFNALPLLLRARQVPELSKSALRDLVEDGDVAVIRASGDLLYVRSSLAGVLGLEMDWRDFEDPRQWPALLFWSHLLQAGLTRNEIPHLLAGGLLTQRKKPHRTTRYHKAPLARLVGYDDAALSESARENPKR